MSSYVNVLSTKELSSCLASHHFNLFHLNMCYIYFQNPDYYRPPFALDILAYQTTKRPDDACDTCKDETEDRSQNPTKPFSNNKADVQYTQSELPRVAPYSYNYNSDVLYENICYVVGSMVGWCSLNPKLPVTLME